MPQIKAAETGRQRGGGAERQILVHGRHLPLGKAAIVRAVETVLQGEGRPAVVSLTFVGLARMRALNARWKRRPEPTDVLAFALAGPDRALAGDIYLCRSIAEREARARRIPLRQELTRLVVHGVLHVLGYDHPDGPGRETSAMWRRQERYVRMLR